MALHVNLYHEIQKAQQQRRRDPLKLGTYLLVFIALCFVGYYFLCLGKASRVISERDAMQAEWQTLEAQQSATKARATELTSSILLAENLVKQIEDRFHWAPLLQQVAALVPPEVQITKMNGELRPSNQCMVTLEGMSAGPEPRKIAEDLRTSLTTNLEKHYHKASAAFVSLEDYDRTVALDGQTWPTAAFTIRIELDTTAGPGAPAEGTPPTAATPPASSTPVSRQQAPM